MLVDLFVFVVLVTAPLFYPKHPPLISKPPSHSYNIEEAASLSFVCCSNYFLQFLFI